MTTDQIGSMFNHPEIEEMLFDLWWEECPELLLWAIYGKEDDDDG